MKPNDSQTLGYSEAVADVRAACKAYVPKEKLTAFYLMLARLDNTYKSTDSGAPNPVTYLVSTYDRVEVNA